jgi:hypothetical protein
MPGGGSNGIGGMDPDGGRGCCGPSESWAVVASFFAFFAALALFIAAFPWSLVGLILFFILASIFVLVKGA